MTDRVREETNGSASGAAVFLFQMLPLTGAVTAGAISASVASGAGCFIIAEIGISRAAAGGAIAAASAGQAIQLGMIGDIDIVSAGNPRAASALRLVVLGALR